MSSAEFNAETRRTIPWWKEPWPWILMAGPALAIVGCAITIALALQSFSDQPILEGGMKRGLVVEKNPAKPPSTEKH